MRATGNSWRSFLRRLFPRRRLCRDARGVEVAGCWTVVVEDMAERGPIVEQSFGVVTLSRGDFGAPRRAR